MRVPFRVDPNKMATSMDAGWMGGRYVEYQRGVPYPTFGIHVCKMNPTHDAGKKDRQKEAHTSTVRAAPHRSLEMKSKPSLKTISDPCMPPKWGWVRDGNLDGVVKLDMHAEGL